MLIEKFKIEVNGQPVRLYTHSTTKLRCFEPDEKNYNRFACRADAEKKADLWALESYSVVPFPCDIGTPTNLSELAEFRL
jgi:hypothetical protein